MQIFRKDFGVQANSVGVFLTYDERWNSKEENYKPHFEPDSRYCGEDLMFVHRYRPNNQYKETIEVNSKEESCDTFLLNGLYYINTRQFIAPEDAKDIRHNPNPDWQDFKHPGVDYDRNIITLQYCVNTGSM